MFSSVLSVRAFICIAILSPLITFANEIDSTDVKTIIIQSNDQSYIQKNFEDVDEVLTHPVVGALSHVEFEILNFNKTLEFVHSKLRAGSTLDDLKDARAAIVELEAQKYVNQLMGSQASKLKEIDDQIALAIKHKDNASELAYVAQKQALDRTASLDDLKKQSTDYLGTALLVYEGGVLITKAANGELSASDIERYSHTAVPALIASNSSKALSSTGVASMLGLAKLTVAGVELVTGSLSDSINSQVNSFAKEVEVLSGINADLVEIAKNPELSREELEAYIERRLEHKREAVNDIIETLENWGDASIGDLITVSISGNIFTQKEAAEQLVAYANQLNETFPTKEEMLETYDTAKEYNQLTGAMRQHSELYQTSVVSSLLSKSGEKLNIDFNNTVILDGGSIGGSGETINNGELVWKSGYITGSGFVNKSDDFELIGDGNKTIQYGGVLTNEGTITQSGDSNLAFNSYNQRYNSRYDKSSTFNNTADSIYDLNGDGDIIGGTHSEHVICSWPSSCNRIEGKAGQGKGTINNEGLFVKSAGDGKSVVEAGVAFNNSGTVEVQSGTLTINVANGDGGQYTAREITALNLNGGSRDNSNYVYADNTSGVIRGNDHNANYSVGTNSSIDVGTGVNGAANFTGDGTLLINGIQGKSGTETSLTGDIGEIIVTGSLKTQSGGKLSLDFDTAVQLDGGSIGGNGETINNGELVWKSGYITGSGFVNKSDDFELIGDGNKTIQYGGVLTNEGTITQSGDSNLAFNSYNQRYNSRYDKSSTFNNTADSIYDLNGDGDIIGGTHSEHVICSWPSSCNRIEGKAGQGKGTINNEGLFVKSAGDGESVVEAGVAFNNTGTVEVQSGTLNFKGSIINDGTIKTNKDTTLIRNGTLVNNNLIENNGTLDLGSNGSMNRPDFPRHK
ncbi:hypothetical protein [Thalassotalea euphylliae]|uniref:Uncharacterized protein n=1 Tax=Thalassotalea euphylliae TaxID=1655234 RepID=A0A3E0U377_9GAMM|nr:hypothetical protein [Thalassotalea euphylliae]REL31047.1 hypothetical protein DXX94_10165 [Thalassotalea euphylliae]